MNEHTQQPTIETLKSCVLERNDWLVSLARTAKGMPIDVACDNFPSYVLEAIHNISELIQQRDELLAVLECIAAYPQSRADEVGAPAMRDMARAAISKATGGAA